MSFASLFSQATVFELSERLFRRGYALSVLSMLGLGGLISYILAEGESSAVSPGMLSAGYKVTHALLLCNSWRSFP